MKKEFNDAIKQILTKGSKVGEVELFKQLATDLETKDGTRATFVKKVHGNSGWVNFDSLITNKSECVEIADLLIINYNKKQKEVRICFLQAKYNRRKTIISFKEDNSALQFELLRRRCRIEDKNKTKFPADILRFSNYKTITSYGIFYAEDKENYEFIFSIPENFYIYGILKESATIRASFNKFDTKQDCFIGYCNPRCIERAEAYCTDENILINYLDNFENVLCNGKIGAPVSCSETIKQWLANLLPVLKNLSEADNLIRDEISKFLGGGDNNNANVTDTKESSYMNMLLIISGENQEKEPSQTQKRRP